MSIHHPFARNFFSGAAALLGVSLLSAAAAPRCAFAQQQTGANADTPPFPYTVTAPIIDGTVDDVWSSTPAVPITRPLVGRAASPQDLSATFRGMYDQTALYLLIEVHDDKMVQDSSQVYDDDSVEVYLDVGNKKANFYSATDFQFYFPWDPRGKKPAVEDKHNAHKTLSFRAEHTSDGYSVEVKLPWAELGGFPPSPAGRTRMLGIDVHVNDDDDGGTRDKKTAWHAVADNVYESPRRQGTVTLTPSPAGVETRGGSGGGGAAATTGRTDAETAPDAAAPANNAPLLAIAGLAALALGAFGLRGLLGGRRPPSNPPPAAAAPSSAPPPTAAVPPAPARPQIAPTPPPPAPENNASAGDALHTIGQPISSGGGANGAKSFTAAPAPPPGTESSQALIPSPAGASPAPALSNRRAAAPGAWPWAGGGAAAGDADAASGNAPAQENDAGAHARLVGVSASVLGIVVPLGGEDGQEAAAFTHPDATAAASTNGANGDEGDENRAPSDSDQVRILVQADGRFALRPSEEPNSPKILLNDRVIRAEHVLQPGDEIQIGPARFRFEA